MKLIEMQNHFYAKGFRPLRITACGGGCGQGWPQSGPNTGKSLPDVLKYVYQKIKKPKEPPVPPLWPYEEKRKRRNKDMPHGTFSATNSYTIVACGGCGNSGWPHGCGGGCGNLFASPYMYMPNIVACGGYGGCGSSLNPGWIEIGGGCGRTYYRYTGCGSPGCGGPISNSCG